MTRWDFVTNHALVIIHVIENPRSTLREIASAAGITERAALSILRALEEEEIISRIKEGRRNRYWINFQALLNHRRQGRYSVAEIAQALMRLAEQFSDDETSGGVESGP